MEHEMIIKILKSADYSDDDVLAVDDDTLWYFIARFKGFEYDWY